MSNDKFVCVYVDGYVDRESEYYNEYLNPTVIKRFEFHEEMLSWIKCRREKQRLSVIEEDESLIFRCLFIGEMLREFPTEAL